MINHHLRQRLEGFLADHDDEACDDEHCLVQEARKWLARLQKGSAAAREHELFLLMLAYLVYSELKRDSDRELKRYKAAVAAFGQTMPQDGLLS